MSMPSDNGESVLARYGDGRTAASRQVGVRIAAHGLVIALPDGATREWLWAEIEAATPLDASSREAMLRRATQDPPPANHDGGATLFIADRAFVQAVIARHGALTATRERWRFAKPGLAFAALFGLVTLVVLATNISPARTIANMVPQSSWEAIGRQMLAGLTKGHRECTKADGQAALDRLMTRLLAADYKAQGYDAKVVEWDLLNAFAMPGRRLVLTSKLVETAGSGEEIAGVLAHEIGHGLERHPETAIVRVLGLMTLARLFASGTGDTFSNASLLLLQLRYNRDGEREADQRALDIMRKSEIRAKPLATFLLRLKKSSGGDGSEVLGGVLSTHPGVDERVRHIDSQPDDYKTTPALTPADLAALRAICKT